MDVVGVLATPDRVWRVELIWDRGSGFYRVWYHGGRLRDRMLPVPADLEETMRRLDGRFDELVES